VSSEYVIKKRNILLDRSIEGRTKRSRCFKLKGKHYLSKGRHFVKLLLQKLAYLSPQFTSS
jgi:hypothetical protein